ncbi:ATP-binding cassette domain-containing protein [Paracoccus sp. (in: a-proteobacteria)]|uniref:ATP-binding cassette domain-containing protein n=1 Tax=Paracoccus sp. TaxID=267 RepID=UPI003A8733D3
MADVRSQPLLVMSNVTRIFPGVKALDDVSFEVLPGEVHGLVGENGAGKSTLMAIASGALSPSSGVVRIKGKETNGDPALARQLGIAIVRQEPALLPDLTVAENLFLGLPREMAPPVADLRKWARGLLRTWSENVAIDPGDRVETLNSEQRFIVEIVKALASEPAVLVLDEPTEHLAGEDVQRLFSRVREVTARGAAVVYISHRIKEVQAIADRLTVLRDGQGQGTYKAHGLSEDQIIELIVGKELSEEFPPKCLEFGKEVMRVEGLRGHGFADVSLSLRRGEILGVGGISDNGQQEFVRALAGLNRPRSGAVRIDAAQANLSSAITSMASGISYLPGDRHRDGIFADLSVRENFSSRSQWRDAVAGFVRKGSEERRTRQAIQDYTVKTPDTETRIGSLSGGNQQKLVLASVVATQPKVLVVDEPTQGVDVGARAEIYRILRGLAEQGVAITVLSSDAAEIAGLCDRVVVFSRGKIVSELEGDEVVENNIAGAALRSTETRESAQSDTAHFWKWASGDMAPIVMVGIAMLVLAGYVALDNDFFLTGRNLGGMMALIATMAIVAYGQQMLMLVGGIDLSVGPTMGLLQVVASFYMIDGAVASGYVTGFAAMVVVAIAIGTLNWFLVEPMRLHPMVATLATYMGVQAVSLILRPEPGGMLSFGMLDIFGYRIGFVPVMFIAAVILAIVLEYLLFRSRIGFTFRALGSRQDAARMAGISPARTRLIAYIGCSLLALVATFAMMDQVGIGDPRAGLNYTLGSIAAVVIGGGSLFGGRGSFVGTLFGAAFIVLINTVTNFLGLDAAWQSYLLGGMIILAVALYSKSRQMVVVT